MKPPSTSSREVNPSPQTFDPAWLLHRIFRALRVRYRDEESRHELPGENVETRAPRKGPPSDNFQSQGSLSSGLVSDLQNRGRGEGRLFRRRGGRRSPSLGWKRCFHRLSL